MSRFDHDEELGFSRRQKNDRLDRSVPDNENYYGSHDPLSKADAGAGDNQYGYVDINSIINDFNNSSSISEIEEEQPARTVQRQSKPPKKKKKKKKVSAGKAVLIAVIAVILAVVIGASGFVNSVLGKITYDDPTENKYISASELKSDKDITNILLIGVDARIIKGEKAENSRSDSMMVISIDKKHNCIKTVSFLRDSWVYIPCIDKNQRLNASCQYGGYSGVRDTIEYNFGVKLDGYIVVNFSVFQTLVDAIGGVEMEVTEAEAKEVTNHKKRYGNVKLKAGKYKLTGKQALAYCRIRKIDTDFMRAYRQRMVIKSIINGVKAQPTKLFSIANASAQYIETNLTKSQIKRIAVSAMSCLKTDMVETRVPFDGTWKYANINGASVITLDAEANKEKLIDYIYNKTADEIQAEEDAKE